MEEELEGVEAFQVAMHHKATSTWRIIMLVEMGESPSFKTALDLAIVVGDTLLLVCAISLPDRHHLLAQAAHDLGQVFFLAF